MIHHTFARDVVEPYLSDLGIMYTFLPKYSCDLKPSWECFHEIESNIEEENSYAELLSYDVPIAVMTAMQEITSSDMFSFFKNVMKHLYEFVKLLILVTWKNNILHK